MDTRIKKKL